MQDTDTGKPGKISGGSGLLLVALLAGAMALLCHQAFQSHSLMWANDTQLGPSKEPSSSLPGTFSGYWLDHWWVGMELPNSAPSLTTIFATLVSPEMFLKVFTPLTMLLLGFCAWVLFRQLKFAPMVCVLGGLAAGLNMHCFSNACWGLGSWNVAIGMIFLAVAALVTDSIPKFWMKAILAGLAIGMAVMEGFDSGAILSVYAGIFTVFVCWITESSVSKRVFKSFLVGGLVVLTSFLIAFCTIWGLVRTQISSVAGAKPTPAEKWTFATQWSLPKMETLRVIIPGIFGYRLEEFSTPPDPFLDPLGKIGSWPERFLQGLTDKSSAYWGRVGEDLLIARLESNDPEERVAAISTLTSQPNILDAMRSDNLDTRLQIVDSVKSQTQRRHSGNGEYAGVLVAMFALFALLQAARGLNSPYTLFERRLVWFWGGATLFSLLAAWGRFSFLYAIIYHLPGVSSFRNPIKFMHPFVIAWVILSGFGLEAFYRCYLRKPAQPATGGKLPQPKNGQRKLAGFDKNFLIGLALLTAGVFFGFLFYAGSKTDLTNYIFHQFNHNPGEDEPAKMVAARIAAFSIDEARWFVLLFCLSAGVVLSAVAWSWARRRTWAFWTLLCAIMIFDLSRADVPWVRYFNYDQKYSLNEVTKVLLDNPFEHRVVGRLHPRGGYDLPAAPNFSPTIHWWIENDFPYRNIQTLEIDQWPRMPVLDATYLSAFPYRGGGQDFAFNIGPAARLWKLTNTRYILAAADFLPALNQNGDPGNHSFRIVQRFDLVPKPGVATPVDAGDLTTQTNDQGKCALIEYGGALPRAKLYNYWLTPTNDQTTLQMLNSPQWDPAQSVLVASDTPVPPPPANPGTDAGAVKITDYAPKDIKLSANAKTSAVLLYNDRTAADWKVWVDGKESQLLRCNYIMRGVFLPAGEHTVEFRFRSSLFPLCVTLCAFAAGILLAVYLTWTRFAGNKRDS